MSNDIKIQCPLCGSGDVVFFKKHTTVDQKLHHCNACGLYFAYPHESYIPGNAEEKVSEPEISQFWGSKEAHTAYNKWRGEENDRIIAIINSSGPIGKVLEIGFGDGPLTEKLIPLSREYWGIEPDRSFFQRTLKRLNIQPDRVFCLKAEEIAGSEWYQKHINTFDTIIMISVFEHLSNPNNILQACHALLKPGGKIFLSTPDSTYFRLYYIIRRVLRMEPWTYFHISFFKSGNLKLLFENRELSVIRKFSAPLVTPSSIEYFGKLTNSRLVKTAMKITYWLRLDRLLRIRTYNFLLQKKDKVHVHTDTVKNDKTQGV